MSVHAETLAEQASNAGLAPVLRSPTRPHVLRRYPRESAVRRLLVATDIAALTLAFVILELLGGFDGGQTSPVLRDLALLAFGLPLWVLLAQAHNLYHADSRRADYDWTEEVTPIVQMATLWSWAILLGVSATGIRHVTIPKLALFWGLTIVLLLLLRSAMRHWAHRQKWYIQSAIVVGPPQQTASIVSRVLRHPEYRINIVACVDTSSESPPDEGTLRQLERRVGPVLMIQGEVDVPELISVFDIDRVMFAPGAKETRDGHEAFCRLADLDVHIDLIPSWSDVVGRRLDIHELEGMPLMTVPRTVIRRSDQWRKRLLDIVASFAGLTLLSPVFVLCAIAIKLDSAGPILFRQRRVGRADRRFELVKFRSMYIDAEARKHEIASLNFHDPGGARGMFKAREDPRVTRVGRWLRRTSLDELPQLVNVLRGDMSLVGPRPLIENEDCQVEGRFRRRLTSSPGLTGPWQIHGRSEIPFEEMINLDYLYVTNWSLWGDVKLILRTVRAVVGGQGAY